MADASVDAALCVQVLEYVPDATAALAELRRAVRPGGRVVVWDVDWATVSWYSAEPGADAPRARGMGRAPRAPGAAADSLRRGCARRDWTTCAPRGTSSGRARSTPRRTAAATVANIERYVASSGEVESDELAAWAAEQRELDARGAFSFSCVQFCFTAVHGG